MGVAEQFLKMLNIDPSIVPQIIAALETFLKEWKNLYVGNEAAPGLGERLRRIEDTQAAMLMALEALAPKHARKAKK